MNLKTLYCVLAMTVAVTANLHLHLNMKSFSNPYGIELNGHQCANTGCETFFRFCLKLNVNDIGCLATFETAILGQNSITSEQFKMTTNSVELQLNNQQYVKSTGDKDLVLFIEVLSNKVSRVLISQFSIDIQQTRLNSWEKFYAKNNLNQELSMDYKLKCAKNFGGSRCENPICSTGCKNGGKCQIKNGSPMCKCNPLYAKGDLCEIKVLHQCKSKCLNGASCLGNGQCLCAPGYTGSRCQTKRLASHCGHVTCYNGGTCFIDNQNEYACMCHPAFTGKLCDKRVLTTTQASTTTSTTTQAPKSTTTARKMNSKIISIAKQSTVSIIESRSYSIQEIILIITLGVGMPIFIILCTILLCRMTRANKVIEINEDRTKKSKKIEHDDAKHVAIEAKDFISNNLFKDDELNETKVCVNTISKGFSIDITESFEQKKFQLVENNIYSIYNNNASDNVDINRKNLNKNEANLYQLCSLSNQLGSMV